MNNPREWEEREAEQQRRDERRERAARYADDHGAFEQTYCSQCGQAFGPGDHGWSHCENHAHLTPVDL